MGYKTTYTYLSHRIEYISDLQLVIVLLSLLVFFHSFQFQFYLLIK